MNRNAQPKEHAGNLRERAGNPAIARAESPLLIVMLALMVLYVVCFRVLPGTMQSYLQAMYR